MKIVRSNIFEEYLNSIVAQGLNKRKIAEIKEEFESHLEDKTDRFIEIGYDEDTAAEKAVAEMGSPNEVREKLYYISKGKATDKITFVFWIVGLMAFGYYSLLNGYTDNPNSQPSPVQVAFSLLYISFVILLLYTNFRRRKSKNAFILALYFLAVTALFWPLSAPTFPTFISLNEIFSAVTGNSIVSQTQDIYINSYNNYSFANLGGIWFNGLSIIFSLFTAIRMRREPVYKKSPIRKNNHMFEAIIALLVTACIALPIFYSSASNTLGHKFSLTVLQEQYYSKKSVSQAQETYNSVKIGMTESETDQILRKENKDLILSDVGPGGQIVEPDYSQEYTKDYEYKMYGGNLDNKLGIIIIYEGFDKTGKLSNKGLTIQRFITFASKTKIENIYKKLKKDMKKSDVMKLCKDLYPDSIYTDYFDNGTTEKYSYQYIDNKTIEKEFKFEFKNDLLVSFRINYSETLDISQDISQ